MKNISNIVSNMDFQYSLEVEYYYNRDYCECEDICRCGTIEDPYILGDINIKDISSQIYDTLYNNSTDKSIIRENNIDKILDFDLKLYFIDRILRLRKMYLNENWDIEITGGYYGEEIDKVTLCYTDVPNDLKNLNLDNRGKIEYLLELEYGFVRDELKNKDWKVETINKSDIVFPNKEHYNKICDEQYYYSDGSYNLPRGILLKDGNKYKVMDGYNRIKNSKSDIIEVIVCDKNNK